jgi:hypothetical protein
LKARAFENFILRKVAYIEVGKDSDIAVGKSTQGLAVWGVECGVWGVRV